VKKSILFLSLVLFGMAIMFSGCSDDKKTNPAKTEGNYSDPTFQSAQGYAETFVETCADTAVHGFSYLEYDFNNPLKVAGDSTSVIYNASSGWWAIYFHHDDTLGNDLTYTDSVRFEGPDGYQMLPDSTTTEGLEYHARLSSDLISDSISLAGDFWQNLAISGIQSELVVFNGSSSADMILQNPSSHYDRDYDASLTDITFNHSDLEIDPDPHPISGNLNFSMLINWQVPQGSGSSNWAVAATFYLDHYHIRFESGDYYWEWDVQYGG